MFSIASGITVEQKTPTTEGVSAVHYEFCSPSFVMAIVGPPGSGKTTLINTLLTHPSLYYKKFNRIVFMTPSDIPGIELVKGENCYPTLRITWLLGLIEESEALGKKTDTIQQILVVIDDLVSDLNKGSSDMVLMQLFYNRRHYSPHVHIHFILTTQKWNMIPAKVRSTVTIVVVFQVSDMEWGTIAKELPRDGADKLLKKSLPLIWNKRNNFVAVNILNNCIFKNFDKLLL